MPTLTLLFPLLVVAACGLYYARIYRKGRAAGGGLRAGFAVHARERWKNALSDDEQITAHGAGVFRRPQWQWLLARNVPILQLAWPVVGYELIVTSKCRLVVAKSGAFGLRDFRAHDLASVRWNAVEAESVTIGDLFGAPEHETFAAVLKTPTGELPLSGVSATLLRASSSHMRAAPAYVAG